MYFSGMRLLRLAHSILDHPVLVLCLLGPCLWASGRSLGSVAGLALFLLRFCFLVILDLTVSPAKRASPKFMKMVSFVFLTRYN